MISSLRSPRIPRRARISVRILSSGAFALYSLVGALGGLLPAQPASPSQRSGILPATAGEHVTLAPPGAADIQASAPELAVDADNAPVAAPRMAPTRQSFLAVWPDVKGATAYELDVSTDPAFSHYVGKYQQLNTGNAPFEVVAGLKPSTRYYYRVRIHDASGGSSYSGTMIGETNAATSLVISPVFDSSINNSRKSAAIRSTIITAIADYQTLYRDPINVTILFRYSSTQPDGLPIQGGFVSRSDWVFYNVTWTTYLKALKADALTQNDFTANATLPATALAPAVAPTAAAGRAIGLDTPPALYADGTVAEGAPFDGIVTFNSTALIRFARPAIAGYYDGLVFCEHEIDEVLGLGSHLNLPPPSSANFRPQDLFTWSAPHVRNTNAAGIRYFSIDPGVTKIVDLNQAPPGDHGDWASMGCPKPYPLVQYAYGCPGLTANITLSSPASINLDVIGYDLTGSFDPEPPTLANISTRLKVQSGEGVLIGGFIVGGADPKRVLLRAIGPSLSLPGTLFDPTLELHSGASIIASNDNWQSDQKAEVVATGIPPTDARESAIVATLDPGAYTAVVKGARGGTGVSLVEIYDLDTTAGSNLSNISTRGFVGTGDNVLIGGFIILGGDSARVLMRALGPSLPVTGALLDPTLELHDHNGNIIASNDNWRDNQQFAIKATGIPPTEDAEAAIVSTLAPGSYTAIVRGRDQKTGISLVEAYRLPGSQ